MLQFWRDKVRGRAGEISFGAGLNRLGYGQGWEFRIRSSGLVQRVWRGRVDALGFGEAGLMLQSRGGKTYGRQGWQGTAGQRGPVVFPASHYEARRSGGDGWRARGRGTTKTSRDMNTCESRRQQQQEGPQPAGGVKGSSSSRRSLHPGLEQ